jgi:hypothetical protein
MRFLRNYITIALALCIVSCSQQEQKELLPEFNTFEYELIEEARYNITISYEHIANTSESEAFARIDSMNYHTTFGEYALENRDLKSSAEKLSQETVATMEEFNIGEMMCEMHLYQVASLVRNNSVVCYDTVMETNFGGVHPIVNHTYECYDLASGNVYDFGYLADGEWVEALQALIYDKLIEEHGDSTLLISPSTMHLPSAVYLTDTGIAFQFQPYEIGTADIGSVTVEVSDEELAATGAPLVW